MQSFRIGFWLSVMILFIGSSSIATATTMRRLDLKDLSTKSQAIVVGKVEDVSSRWDDAHREIYTYITLRVGEGLKGGKGGETVTIRQLGGEVGSVGSMVPGMARFQKGEEVVVFLTANDPTGYPWVYGLQQGKFSIVSDADGRRLVRGNVDELRLVSPDGSPGKGDASSVLLSAFLSRIRTYVAPSGTSGPTVIE